MSKLDRATILAMEPGKELDALIAEHVMGWRKGRKEYGELNWYPDPEKRHGGRLGTPAYSADVTAAWEVKNKMRSYDFDHPIRRKFYTILCGLVDDYLEVDPHHIVKAALLAKLESEG